MKPLNSKMEVAEAGNLIEASDCKTEVPCFKQTKA